MAERSVVAERFEMLEGKSVKVSFTNGSEPEDYVFLGVVPAGREYFFHLRNQRGCKHLILTSWVGAMSWSDG